MEIEDMNLEENLDMEKNMHLEVVMEPKVGTLFNSEDEARECYSTYAKSKGFGVVTKGSKKNDNGVKCHINYGCHRSGKPRTTTLNPVKSHPTSKTDCKAGMNISLQIDGKWMLNSIELDHNHGMDPAKVNYLKCYRKLPPHMMRTIESNTATGIRLNKIIASCEIEAGGPDNLTWTCKDARNHKDKERRLQLKEGDADAMHKYFIRMQKENGDFFYAIDLDEDNRLRNVFWADARSRALYKEFGDVVTFDTTYLVNTFDMPFAPFVGVNHHGQSILFGCGLVSREDTTSFVWLFESWLSCMFDSHLNAIITDQCKAMQNAISQVLPNVRHRWCLWHIMKKIPEKLKSYEKYKPIKKWLKNVVYDSLDPEEFEQNWANLIKDFDLQGNNWLAGLYEERHRWVPAFLKDTFWAGMSTTQRSESMNAFFDGYVHSNTTLKEFVEQYDNALRKKVQKEEEEDTRSLNFKIQNVSPYKFENQFQQAYTVEKCKQFREQVALTIGCNVLTIGPVVNGITQFEVEANIQVGKKKDRCKTCTFLVHFNEESRETNCNCRLFESKGMVCSHIISVWSKKKLEVVPDKYILARWTKNSARPHTKIKVSYANLERKPEFARYDSLLVLFNEAADIAIYSISKTNRMAARLREIKVENDLDDEKRVSEVEPTIGKVQIESFKDKSITVGDPSKGPRRGRPPMKRKQSTTEQFVRKIIKSNERVQCSGANGNSLPDVEVHTHAMGFDEFITQESGTVIPSQGSAEYLGTSWIH